MDQTVQSERQTALISWTLSSTHPISSIHYMVDVIAGKGKQALNEEQALKGTRKTYSDDPVDEFNIRRGQTTTA